MNSIALDTLFLRRPKLNYVSPPVCEAVFSGTGSPIIILPDIPALVGPTGLALGGSGITTLRWNNYPGALCYNVYSAIYDTTIFTNCTQVVGISQSLKYKLIAECVSGNEFNLSVQGCYRISAITGEGETDLSNPICTACYIPPCPFGSIWNPNTFRCETCQYPVCPPGFVPDGVTCLCAQCGGQNCPPGFVVDPGNHCNCVPCGSQHCPEGYIVDPGNSCGCIPSSGPFQVCNEEQTATCDPEEGDPVTVPAGTFCTNVNTAAEIPAAQNNMNAQALAEAETLLCCGSLDWNNLAWGTPNITIVGLATASFSPANADGATFTASAQTGAVGMWFGSANNKGNLTYPGGPAINIRITVHITGSGSPNAPGTVQVFFDNVINSRLSIDGGPSISSIFSTNVSGFGTHTIDFSTPDTCDSPTPLLISIQPSVSTGGSFPGTSQITMTGTVANV